MEKLEKRLQAKTLVLKTIVLLILAEIIEDESDSLKEFPSGRNTTDYNKM